MEAIYRISVGFEVSRESLYHLQTYRLCWKSIDAADETISLDLDDGGDERTAL